MERATRTEAQLSLEFESQTTILKLLSRGLTDFTTPTKETSVPSFIDEISEMGIGVGWMIFAPNASMTRPTIAIAIAEEGSGFFRIHETNRTAMQTYRQAF
jgi:hypothetical protein